MGPLNKVLIIAFMYSFCIYEAFNQQFSGMISFSKADGAKVTAVLSISFVYREIPRIQVYATATYNDTPTIDDNGTPPADHIIETNIYVRTQWSKVAHENY